MSGTERENPSLAQLRSASPVTGEAERLPCPARPVWSPKEPAVTDNFRFATDSKTGHPGRKITGFCTPYQPNDC
jgi:hypothetical protein